MTLYLIGLGFTSKDISLKALEAIKKCHEVYFENYTTIGQFGPKELEKAFNKCIVTASREFIEQSDSYIRKAKNKNVSILFGGDPLLATTHTDILLQAKKLKVKTEVLHSPSIFSAVARTGLQLYKFGKTTSIPFSTDSYQPETPYNILKENLSINAHTLFLLDLEPATKKFVSINDAITYLLKLESIKKLKIFTAKTMCVACARLGLKDEKIEYATAEELLKTKFGSPPHCLIVPSQLHFVEEEFLKQFE